MPDAVPVRQARSLPPASFRFHLTVDILALGYVLGTINPHSGLAPVRLHPCWAHMDINNPAQERDYFFQNLLRVFYFFLIAAGTAGCVKTIFGNFTNQLERKSLAKP
jgi:hypothetical protein